LCPALGEVGRGKIKGQIEPGRHEPTIEEVVEDVEERLGPLQLHLYGTGTPGPGRGHKKEDKTVDNVNCFNDKKSKVDNVNLANENEPGRHEPTIEEVVAVQRELFKIKPMQDGPGAPVRNQNAKQNNGSGTTIESSKEQDRGSSYLLRRMLRDSPEHVDALERGDYPSVRQAAIAAGIVKVLSPLERAIAAYQNVALTKEGQKTASDLAGSCD